MDFKLNEIIAVKLNGFDLIGGIVDDNGSLGFKSPFANQQSPALPIIFLERYICVP